MPSCIFCEIIARDRAAEIVFESDHTFGILDHRPLFPGHVLLMPRQHCVTLPDLPADYVAELFVQAQLLCRAVQSAMDAQGTFVAINNTVSQSVPHLHVHIVPRTKGDGLKGFFWPRHSYDDDEHRALVGADIRAAVAALS